MVKFSIITPAKNASMFIEKNIKSVLNQNFTNFEHIIVLNESDHITYKEIKKFKDARIKLYTLNDNGPYEAMNYGIEKSQGEFITILNSDDYFFDTNVLEVINDVCIKENSINYFYGCINIIKNNRIFRKWKPGNFSRLKFFFGWHPPHPSLFLKRKDLDLSKCLFDKSFKISADYEFMVRYFVKKKKKAFFINKVLVTMRHGGLSSRSLKNIILSNLECYYAWYKNNYYLMFYIFFIKPLKKLTQITYK